LGGWRSPGDYAAFKFPPLSRHDPRTTNAIERLNEEFRRRIKTQAVLPCAQTVPMLLWALLASGQISMRKVDGWQTLDKAIEPMTLDLAA
jgi:putative transposase